MEKEGASLSSFRLRSAGEGKTSSIEMLASVYLPGIGYAQLLGVGPADLLTPPTSHCEFKMVRLTCEAHCVLHVRCD